MATQDMVLYCFDVLSNHLSGKDEKVQVPFDENAEFPLFITWKKNNELRGCIGTLSPTTLSNMEYYVFQSALRDHRFHPIQSTELPDLHCSVSLLTDYEPAKHYKDWDIGTHGIMIEFSHSNRSYKATYLPQVALEQRWTQEEAIESLIRKAGYQDKIQMELKQTIRVTRYQSSKLSLSYAQYQQYRNP